MIKLKVKSKKLNVSRGFTLVEIIVAVGIFVTVVTISLGAIVSLYNANNKSQSLASVINNLNYSVESMIRDVRFATTYHCGTGTWTEPQNCTIESGGGTYLALNTASSLIIYKYEAGKISKSTDGGVTYTDVTSSEVTIDYAKFYVYYATPGDEFQPQVQLIVRGYAGDRPVDESRFDIQTTISQRALDL